jgi:hypothetical protein
VNHCGVMASRVIVVMASRRDATARTFVERYAAYGACLLTPDDLSMAGWRHHVGDSDMSTAVVAGRPLATRDICGVLTRLPWVVEQDLDFLVPADRAYVAAEMMAFLRFWLWGLQCPILNRPRSNSLSGPCWRHEQWVHTAARLGIPITTTRRHVVFSRLQPSRENPPSDSCRVTIVGQRYVGSIHQALAKQARSLADAAGVDLLDVHFSGPEPGSVFVRANPWPNIDSDDVADAILAYFEDGSIRGS